MRQRKVLLLAGLAGGLCVIPFGIHAIRALQITQPSKGGAGQRPLPAQCEDGLGQRFRIGDDLRGSSAESEQTENLTSSRRSPEYARERAEDGIGRIERIVSDKKLTARNAAAFRAQMAPRLVAAGADRHIVESWFRQTLPPPAAQPRQSDDPASDSAAQTPDYSKLTPEEREVIGMNANFIHATSQPHRN